MDTLIHYDGYTITLKEFCNSVDFDCKEVEQAITSVAQKEHITVQEAITVVFPFMYINILGDLVIEDELFIN